MKELSYDIAVIGGGAAGLTAAAKCSELGRKCVVIERNPELGGVLLQCIHSGFGLHYFHEELTGPEYAERVLSLARKAGAAFLTDSSVMQIENAPQEKILTIYSRQDGVTRLHARAVILAMGCRERCRGNLGIPGDRLPGVFNAGTAQQLLNLDGLLPGKQAVIIGSGDIGLIMARRLRLCGIGVKCVLEIMPYPAGLSRNIAQCLEDFNIPLHLGVSINGIYGKKRVEYVTYAPLVNGRPDLEHQQRVECDTVLFSVGLIPENELSAACGVTLNPLTGGAVTDNFRMTDVPGIFSCGNVLHVHDLVDFVSQEAELCAEGAVRYCKGGLPAAEIAVSPGENVRYVVPNRISRSADCTLFLRSRSVMEKAELRITAETGALIFAKPLRYVKPAEMISLPLPAEKFSGCSALTVSCKEL